MERITMIESISTVTLATHNMSHAVRFYRVLKATSHAGQATAVTRVRVASHDQARARARSSRVELPLLVASDSQLCRGGDGLEPADLDGDAWSNADDEGENDRRLTTSDTKTDRLTRHRLSDRVALRDSKPLGSAADNSQRS